MPRTGPSCPACSALNPARARFCSSCGKALGASGSSASPPKRGGRWRKRIGLGVAGLLALCVGLAVLGSLLDDEDDGVPTAPNRPTREVAALVDDAPGTPAPNDDIPDPSVTVAPTATVVPTGTAVAGATATVVPTSIPTELVAASLDATAAPTATKDAHVFAGAVEVRVMGATMAPSFGPPLDLDPLDDGRSYLLLTVEVRNVGSGDERMDSDHFRLIVGGEEVKEATDVVDDAKGPLGLRSMGDRLGTQLGAGDRELFLLAYKVDPDADGYVLLIDKGDEAEVDLAPWLGEGISAPQLVPTATPEPTATATPVPTNTPVPTQTPVPTATPAPPDGVPDGAVLAKVVDVVDGDTIKVEVGGESATVRLTGIDTPETVDPDTADECYGAEASDFTARLLKGRAVWLEDDVEKTDQYDRWLRYVWIIPLNLGSA